MVAPGFAKPSIDDGKKVEIAAIDPDFAFAPRPSVCATGHPSPSRTLGLAPSDSLYLSIL